MYVSARNLVVSLPDGNVCFRLTRTDPPSLACLGCQLRTPTESTINRTSRRSVANALPRRRLMSAHGLRGGGVPGAVSGAGRGTPGRSGASSSPPPEGSPGTPSRADAGDGRPAQVFNADTTPRKTGNPET